MKKDRTAGWIAKTYKGTRRPFPKKYVGEYLNTPRIDHVNVFLKPLIDELWDIANGDPVQLMNILDKKIQQDLSPNSTLSPSMDTAWPAPGSVDSILS